jgi:hypothetical protein
VQFMGNLGQLPGQLRGEQIRGRRLAAVQPLQRPVLLGL